MEAASKAARVIQDETQRLQAGLTLTCFACYEMALRHERFDWDGIFGSNAELLLWISDRYNYDVSRLKRKLR
eukprot:COSAG02_NODE_233_length_27847_cov_20.383055_17_plen_72_part_00